MTGAYSFIGLYSSKEELCTRLNQLGWKWAVGDSHWYGDYLAARPFPGVRVRIVDFPARIQEADCSTPMSEIDAACRNLLAQVPAHDIREVEWFD